MSYYVVIRETGPGWKPAKPLREQAAWDEHADFINAAAEDGLVLVGGALGDGGRFLLILAIDMIKLNLYELRDVLKEGENLLEIDIDAHAPDSSAQLRAVDKYSESLALRKIHAHLSLAEVVLANRNFPSCCELA